METHQPKLSVELKKEEKDNNGTSAPAQPSSMEREQNDINGPAVTNAPENGNKNPIHVDSSEGEVVQSAEQGDQSCPNAQNQLVLYDPAAAGAGAIVPVSDASQTPLLSRSSSRNQSSRALPSIGAFTVQCAKCFKWRLIPTQKKYEEIREHILEHPFYCETAKEWRPEVSCDDPEDISQDGTRLWAIDKPNIAQPPPGWQRLLRIRAEGGTKFADVYYEAPSGKRFRSMVEVEKYLQEHPEYVAQGIKLSQFSFQIPRPLQENYVRKRASRSAAAQDFSGSGLPGSLEPTEANPISWVPPDDQKLPVGGLGLSNPYADTPEPKRRKIPSKPRCNDDAVFGQNNVEVGQSSQL